MKPSERIDELKQRVDRALGLLLDEVGGPTILKRAMAHALLSGGKRLRPLLVLASSELFESTGADPMAAACAVELIHTYSLIHDDLPAMDNDALRRGVPTCHIIFGEAMAILAGDALLTESFHVVAKAYAGRPAVATAIVCEMAAASGCAGMVGGQVLDVSGEDTRRPGAQSADATDLRTVHDMKTGALIRACFTIGAILGEAGDGDATRLAACGSRTGLAFQVIDDCLDATGSDDELGKSAGSDARKGKENFVSLMGLERARAYAVELKEEALSLLSGYGENGDLLRHLIIRAVERRS